MLFDIYFTVFSLFLKTHLSPRMMIYLLIESPTTPRPNLLNRFRQQFKHMHTFLFLEIILFMLPFPTGVLRGWIWNILFNISTYIQLFYSHAPISAWRRVFLLKALIRNITQQKASGDKELGYVFDEAGASITYLLIDFPIWSHFVVYITWNFFLSLSTWKLSKSCIYLESRSTFWNKRQHFSKHSKYASNRYSYGL